MMSNNKNGDFFYLILSALFIASLVAGNLIFQKFVGFTPFTFLDFGAEEGSRWHRITHFTFEVSVGLISYPITFLVTDLISEIFGRKKADNVVKAGLFASVFTLVLILISNAASATVWSPINDATFEKVFGLTGAAVLASMVAYLLAQFIDIRIFHFWKKKTKGKKLWLRNNFSTIPSQMVDTASVLLLLCSFDAIAWDKFGILFLSGFSFKVLIALIDTPLFYLFTHLTRKQFNLKLGEELTE